MPSNLRRWFRLAVWSGALCLAAASLWAQEPPATPLEPEPEGERVSAIRVVTESGEVLEENPSNLPQKVGQAFDAEAVRESLRRLYRTGQYADVRAEASRLPVGLRLDFIVRLSFFINLVRVTGLREPPGEPLALAALRLGLGEPFRETSLQEAVERLRQALHDDGLYQAQLDSQLTPHLATRQMDILVRVTPGPRARIGSIALRNYTEFAEANLLRRAKLKPGRELTLARLDRASERLRKFLAKKGHLGARAVLRRGQYDARSNTVPLAIELSAGPRVRIEVLGAKIPDKELRKLIPIYQEGSVDEDLLQEGRRNLRDYLERQGYFDAQVRYSVSAPPEAASGGANNAGLAPERADSSPSNDPREQVIIYEVERGPQRRLVGVAFEGNRYFGDELLFSRLRIQPAAYATPGRFSRRLLDRDVASVRDLYLANGFRDVQVRSEILEDYQGEEGDLFVRVHIAEGPQTRVAELKLEGNAALSNEMLLGVIGSTVGQPYSEFNVSTDRDNILALYYNEGFPEARFDASVEELEAGGLAANPQLASAPGNALEKPPRVRLNYRVNEGQQVKVARVLIEGYEHTRREVVEREVKIRGDEPLREGDVVETQRRLYNLGIFSRVAIAPQNPTGTDPTKTLVVLVEEAKRYTLAYGFGVEAQRLASTTDPTGRELRASPRGLLEVTKANFTGRADTLSFKVRASTLQGRALMSYLTPNFFERPSLSLQLTAFADKTRDINTFSSRRYEASVQLIQRASPVTSLLYRYAFRRVTVGSLQISPQQIPLPSQPTRVSAFGGTWFRERRNNPADATRGDFNTVDLSLAGKSIGSSASFVRLFFQNSMFHPIARHFVFARSVRFGMQKPIGNSTSAEIPLPERFFAGGGTSLRGFGLNQAGPRDPQTGFPVGGQAMLIFNQEFRFPMRLPFVGSRLGGALFYDAGNVFTDVESITLRWKPDQATITSGHLSYLSHTVGLGFRYATPIGPVRVDVGFQLNPAQFFVACTAAEPGCTNGLRLTRLPRFQFFFNLGSIF